MKSLKIIVPVLLISMMSCNEKIFTGNIDCDECYSDKPGNADLVIDLTINYKYPEVPVIVYKGDVEDNDIFLIDTAFASPYYVYVPVDGKYSVKAEYRTDNQVIFAVDGTNLKVLSVTDACDTKCFIVENEEMDVRLGKKFP